MTQQEPEWIEILRDDVRATGSITKTAERVGVSRGAISAILNKTASSPYANGKSSTERIAQRVMNTIGRIACPFLSELHGTEYRITGLECRETAGRERAPTNSPRAMAHWRACQGCDKRVAPAPEPVQVKPVASTPRRSRAIEQPEAPAPQQAGVIDKVTLPLPEVGGPQVGEPS